MATVLERLAAKLSTGGIPFDVNRHEPVYTSEQAAAVRGVALASGAKALVCKVDDQFVLLVMPADRKLDSKAARASGGWKKIRFADKAEVEQITGLEPGSIPPFGSLFDLPTWCDPALAASERINFNAGDHGVSFSMRFEDYLAAEQPKLAAITSPPG